MKLRLARVVAVLLVASVVWIAYNQRTQIGAWFWQIRNHGVLTFGSYLVPVPDNWYVTDSGPGDQVLVQFRTGRRVSKSVLRLPATINLLDAPPPRNIGDWISLESSTLPEGHKERTPVSRRDFNLGDERMSCLGGEALPRYPGSQETPIAWHCRSSGRLEVLITATEPDMNQIWDIVSRIRPLPHKQDR